MTVYAAHMGEARSAYTVLFGKAHGKERLRGQKRRHKDNIKIEMRGKRT